MLPKTRNSHRPSSLRFLLVFAPFGLVSQASLAQVTQATETAKPRCTHQPAGSPVVPTRTFGDNSYAFLNTTEICFDWAVASIDGKTQKPDGSEACPEVGHVDDFICHVNPTAHPNLPGADAYQKSISEILAIAWARGQRER